MLFIETGKEIGCGLINLSHVTRVEYVSEEGHLSVSLLGGETFLLAPAQGTALLEAIWALSRAGKLDLLPSAPARPQRAAPGATAVATAAPAIEHGGNGDGHVPNRAAPAAERDQAGTLQRAGLDPATGEGAVPGGPVRKRPRGRNRVALPVPPARVAPG